MSKLILFLFLCFLNSWSAQAGGQKREDSSEQSTKSSDYCSLAVRVLTPDQKHPLNVPVTVRENSGRVSYKLTAISADVNFCDLGIVPVTVTVGRNECNQIIVRDVPLRWDEPYVLAVTYDPEPCMIRRPRLSTSCEELLRIADTAGNWIENALIQFNLSGFTAQNNTDNSGRAFLVIEEGEIVEGTISAKGYQSKPFSLSCSRSEPFHEEFVKLEKENGSGL